GGAETAGRPGSQRVRAPALGRPGQRDAAAGARAMSRRPVLRSWVVAVLCACAVAASLRAQEARYYAEGRFLLHEIAGGVREPAADFEIEVPAKTEEIEVVTGAGDVAASGLAGRATLATRGGNITVDRLGGTLKAETRGGNIDVGTVGAAARLITAGGNVRRESAAGAAVAETARRNAVNRQG